MPEFKLWLAFNHKPIVRGADEAIWRRIHLIPFTAHFGRDVEDPYLVDKLANEASGVLAWAVDGCLEWQKERLGQSDTVKSATANYRAESDLLATFLMERTVQDTTARIRASELYSAYKLWCEINSERPITGQALGRRLSERGLDRYHDRDGWYYVGLGLL